MLKKIQLLILCSLVTILNFSDAAQACTEMVYEVYSPAYRHIDENSAFNRAITKNVEQILLLRGYKPVHERSQLKTGTTRYCRLQFTVHDWPTTLQPVQEIKSSLVIAHYDLDHVPNTKILFEFKGTYEHTLHSIPKQTELKKRMEVGNQ